MKFLFLSALLLFACADVEAAPNGDVSKPCPNLHLDGVWKTAEPTVILKSARTYRISQTNCYVLVFDTGRQSTWKIDLSGAHKIRVPTETVEANQVGGAEAARNMRNLQVDITPTHASESDHQSYYAAQLEAESDFEATKSFPFALRTRIRARIDVMDNSGCPSCTNAPVGSVRIILQGIEVLDITKGLPSGLQKSSFLSGMNSVLDIAVPMMSWRAPVLYLIKDT